MYNRILLVPFLLFLIVGCSNKIYNTPFINVDETINLEFGMSQSRVLEKLNEPLYVSYGDKDEIIWVYEVRTIDVKSKVILYETLKVITVIPLKKADDPSDERHASPVHKLSLTFSKGKLSSWRTNDE